MDFDPDDSQQMIRDSAAKLFAARCPRGAVLKMAEHGGTCPPDLWQEMAGLGWMGIPFPEEYGGLGMGFLELSMVLQEMGRVALPGPYFASVVSAGLTLLLGANEEQKRRWLPQLAGGSTRGTLALYEPGGRFLPADWQTTATPVASGYELSGIKLFVPAGAEADLILCPASEPDGTSAVFVVEATAAGLARRALPTLDITRPLAEVKLDRVVVPRAHRLDGAAPALLSRVADFAAVALSVEMLGAIEHLLALTVDYARQRVQFGKPIGSYQAIKHKCADMHMRSMTADAAARYAAWTADQALKGADVPLAHTASVAKVFCQQAFNRTVSDAIQAHGGIGFTWEYELHLYLKRAKGVESMFGNEAFHRERVMQLGGERV